MTGFGSKWSLLQANLIFYIVFATLASQTVLAEKLKVFKMLAKTPAVRF